MEELIASLADKINNSYFAKYRGFVVDNKDPEKRGRLKLRVPAVIGEAVSAWALPCMPFGGLAAQGLFVIPEVGAQVWVECEGGDPSKLIWTGTFWQAQGDAPVDDSMEEPTTRILKTPKGHHLLFEDKDDEENIHLEHSAGAILDIDPEGTVEITDAAGARVLLDAENSEMVIEDANGNTITLSASGTTIEDANGNKIEMAASGITVKGQQIVVEGSQVLLGGQGGEPVIKGQSFLTLFATHVHTTTAPGSPTSPPIPQGEMSTLSMKVMST